MKRLFDIVFAAVGLVVLSPLLLLVAIAVKLSDGGPALFRQERIGQGGRPFYIVKFRSMVANAERLGPGITKDNDPRITPIGRFLRKTKLDELPQLWNVVRGEMSFVGPRPEVPVYVAKYTPEQRKVLALQPGITDLATLEFRDEEEMLRVQSRKQKAEMLKAESRKQKAESKNEGGGGEGTAEYAEYAEGDGPRTVDGKRRTENGPRTTGHGTTERGGRKTDHGPLTTGPQRTEEGVEEFYIRCCVPRKIELNLEYAKRANVWEDVKLILRTLWALGARRSAQDTTQRATLQKVQGTAARER